MSKDEPLLLSSSAEAPRHAVQYFLDRIERGDVGPWVLPPMSISRVGTIDLAEALRRGFADDLKDAVAKLMLGDAPQVVRQLLRDLQPERL